MPTPAGSSVPYASNVDLLERADWRVVQDYLSDDGYRPTRLDAVTPGNQSYNRLYALLQQASGTLEAAVMHGGMYTLLDLQALTGNSLAFMKGLVSDIAEGDILDRRMGDVPIPKRVTDAEEKLEALASGAMIFALQEQVNAGLPTHTIEDPIIPQNRNLPTTILRRYFGNRTKDLRQR